MKKYKRNLVFGFTLLELTVAMAMLVVISTSCMMLVRTSYAAWSRHTQDNEKRQSAMALLRHLTRQVRQAKAVSAITDAAETSGSLSLLKQDGTTVVWEHDAATKTVNYGVGSATEVLATGIEGLRFSGVKRNFVATTDVGLIHTVVFYVDINVDRPSGSSAEMWSGSGQIRSW